MGVVRFLHLGPEAGPHGELEDFWLNASSSVAPSEYLRVPPVKGRELLNHVSYYLKKHRPQVLITHADNLIRPAAWSAYAQGTKLICHRYNAGVLPRGATKRSAYARASAYVVPTYAAAQAILALGVDESRIHVIPLPPMKLEPVVDAPPNTVGVWKMGPHFPAVAKHFLRHSPETLFILGPEEAARYPEALTNVRKMSGSLRKFLSTSSVILDFTTSGVHRYLAEGRYWGRPILVPEGKINLTTYGEGAVYYNRGNLPALLLKALTSAEPVVPLEEDPVAALTALYTRMAV